MNTSQLGSQNFGRIRSRLKSAPNRESSLVDNPVRSERTAPVDTAPQVGQLKQLPKLSVSHALESSKNSALQVTSALGDGGWMIGTHAVQPQPPSPDDPIVGLVVLSEPETVETTQAPTFQQVVRNERARTGLLQLLDSDKWTDQLKGSRLESLRGELEKPETDVKQTLMGALGQLEGGYTGQHMSRAIESVGKPLATALGMSSEEVKALDEVSGLYDIGKLAVDESILNYDGKWPEEKAGEWFGKVSNHVHPEIVEPLLDAFDVSDLGKKAVLHHHERPNGWPYCKGAESPGWDSVPRVARVVGMADTVDAMQWRKANINRPVEQKLDRAMMQKFLTGDAEKGKVDGELVEVVFDKVI
jgi:hypothetical protein